MGEPGEWDDDMLWTMHVTPDPDRPGEWRMFYTGLARSEFGRVQRVGLARSKDLYRWERCNGGAYPLEITSPLYESSTDEGRHWVSFRDPFFYVDPQSGERLLLCSARVKDGPVIRRGCVGVARETSPDCFSFEAPLHRPGLYDDVEVPNLLQLDGRYYLLGSIREDTKIHYWYSNTLEGPYENFFDNVILPTGNYAGRICRSEERVLLFNFFFQDGSPLRARSGQETSAAAQGACHGPGRPAEAEVQPGFRQTGHAQRKHHRLSPVQVSVRQSPWVLGRPAGRPAPVVQERL
ncbi:hypothetical protein QW131_04115 [Roseibium salinum]|nr:hypothetical protein [Roseibium salinum]